MASPTLNLDPEPFELQSEFLKGGYIGDYIGEYSRAYEGDTRSLDYGSFECLRCG